MKRMKDSVLHPIFIRYQLLILCVGFLMLPSAHLLADLSASPIIMSFTDGGENRKDITLTNSGKYTKYMEVSALRIAELGEHPENLIGDPDPRKVGLLVAPRRLTLKPGEQKVIRVIRLENTIESDEAWRVHIRPAKTEIVATSTGVMAQIAYKALVFARPKDAMADLVGVREGNNLKITNQGNTNLLLTEGEQCSEEGVCKRITGKRLWPGKSWQTELPFSTSVIFKTMGPKGEEEVVY